MYQKHYKKYNYKKSDSDTTKSNPKYPTTKSIVLVESFTKSKKIEEYLGPGYKCIATLGHLRELPSSLESIDLQTFTPRYQTIPSKKKLISTIREEISHSREVILATDDDREGEAIAWHCCVLFKLPPETTKRIRFHEITPDAIQHAIQHPGVLNRRLVDAQQARQIMDLLIGFTISPILWGIPSLKQEQKDKEKFSPLSAGRCQTPALKLVQEHCFQQEGCGEEEENRYSIVVHFGSMRVPFCIEGLDSDGISGISALGFLGGISFKKDYIVSCKESGEEVKNPVLIYENPPLPFSTSSLLQSSPYSLQETMKICQTLYENGYITYHRTDSHSYSQDFLDSTREYIQKHFTKEYFGVSEIIAVDQGLAHEAIRVTDIGRTDISESESEYLNAKEKKMYRLIWENSLESCMSPASKYKFTTRIESHMKGVNYVHYCNWFNFLGWKKVKLREKAEKDSVYYSYFLSLHGKNIDCKMASTKEIKNQEENHGIKEQSLVSILEKKGIGRPSTFSSIVGKIIEREYVIPWKQNETIERKVVDYYIEEPDLSILRIRDYVEKSVIEKKNKLYIQPIGEKMIEYLYSHFGEIFDYDFTKEMEEDLDRIANGDGDGDENTDRFSVCSKLHKKITNLIG
jgi:DNA topoisomerase-1